MASEEHCALLKRGAHVWNEWRRAHPLIAPDLSGAGLNNADLRHVDLRLADISRGKLNGAKLAGAKLTGANLSRAKLKGAEVNGADLSSANLSHADLYASTLTGVNFNGAKLTGADLRNANLDSASFLGSELSKVLLQNASLRFTNLRNTKLFGADLGLAKLNGASVIEANLGGANLFNAALSSATVHGADLSGVNLSGADLHDAHLIDTTLTGANVESAYAGGTSFINIDLREVENLEGVIHYGPSEVSISTLFKSEGEIPDGFLRGCGLRDWEIEAARLYRKGISTAQVIDIVYKVSGLRSDPLIQFYSCFISYSHADKLFARKLHDNLQRRGIRCWLDEHQMLPGDDIFEEVDRGIRLWDKVLLCCSANALKSWWVDDEITKAFEKEQRLMKERGRKVRTLIPLNLDSYLFGGWNSGKASQVRSRLAPDFTDWENNEKKFEEQFERLVRALRADDGGREVPPKPRL